MDEKWTKMDKGGLYGRKWTKWTAMDYSLSISVHKVHFRPFLSINADEDGRDHAHGHHGYDLYHFLLRLLDLFY